MHFVCLLCIPLCMFTGKDFFCVVLISPPRRLPIWTWPHRLSPAPPSHWLPLVAEHHGPIWGMIISWLAGEVLFPEAPLCAKSSHSFDMWTSSSWWNAIVMNKWGIASAVGPRTKRTLPSWHANGESCSLPVLPVGPSWKCEEMHIQTNAFWGGWIYRVRVRGMGRGGIKKEKETLRGLGPNVNSETDYIASRAVMIWQFICEKSSGSEV